MPTKFIMPLSSDYDELSRLVREYLASNKEVDLRVFLSSQLDDRPDHDLINEVANILRSNDEYSFTSIGLGDKNSFIISKKSFWDRRPFWDKVRTGFITALFSLIVGAVLFLLQNRGQVQTDTRQDEHLQRLSDSLTIYQKQLTDSIAAIRADTSFLRKSF